MSLYLMVSSIIFISLGLAWKKSDFINWLIKVLLIVMSVIGLLLYLQANGFVIKS